MRNLIALLFAIFISSEPMTANAIPWARSSSNPLFGGTGASASYEPVVLYENGVFRMWHTQGWDTAFAMNYATSADGITWTAYGGNPVLGDGGSGYGGNVCRPEIIRVAGVYHVYFASNGAQNADLMHAISADGITWTTPTVIIAHNAKTWSGGWANSFVWIEGATWYMMLDGVPQAGAWAETLATSDDGIHWTFALEGYLTSLNPVNGGFAYGGVWTTKRNGVYYTWYLASKTVGANLPTDLYYATSTDLINWTIENGGQPFLVHTGSFPEFDQVGDPWIVEALGKTFLYFEGVNNNTSENYIQVLTVGGTLEGWIDGYVYHRGTSTRIPVS